MFGGKWKAAQGKVIDRKDIMHNAHGMTRRYAYVFEVVASADGSSFRAEYKDPIGGNPTHFVAPNVGELVALNVDWKGQEVKLDRDDPERTNAPDPLAGKHAQDDRFAASLAGGPNAPLSKEDLDGMDIAPHMYSIEEIRQLQQSDPNAAKVAQRARALAQVAARAAPASAESAVDQLAKLADLHAQGALSDQQFEAVKAKVMGEDR
jgi:hypothetical protein